MSELEQVAAQLKQVYDGDAWHGPSLRDILKDVTPEKAAEHPIAEAHSIWELVLHIAVWEDVVRRRMAGETIVIVAAEENFPAAADVSEAGWQSALERLDKGNRQLRAAMQSFPQNKLEDTVAGKKYDFRTMLYGAAQHQIYHAGQITLLKRAVSGRA